MSVHTRRRVLAGLAAGAATLVYAPRLKAAAESLETTTVRFLKGNSICFAPEYIADDLLRAEGFTDIRYIDANLGTLPENARQIDFTPMFVSSLLIWNEAHLQMTILSGLHVGCFELFGHDGVGSIADLKGKRVGVPGLGGTPWHAFLSIMAAHVGLDPIKDLQWVVSRTPSPPELFAAGKVDAFIGFPPDSQEMRARKIGHVVGYGILSFLLFRAWRATLASLSPHGWSWKWSWIYWVLGCGML